MILDIDPTRCTGCMTCVLYCSLAHEDRIIPSLSRISILSNRNRTIILPIACLPCAEKHCVKACPEPGAIGLQPGGTVVINEALCTACGKCTRACRIGAVRVVRVNGRGKNGKAVALKCDQCGGDPWCVRVCPSSAIRLTDDRGNIISVLDRILDSKRDLEHSESSV